MSPRTEAVGSEGSEEPHLVEPLSAVLERMFTGGSVEDRTLNELLLSLESRGPLALIILLNLPFLAPVGLPGLSIIFGVVILYLSSQMMLGRAAVLPAFLGNRRVQGRVLVRMVGAGSRALRWLERGIHPRPSVWVASTASRRFNAALIFWGAFLLALPLPPTIPCSNLVPGVAIILLAASMAEEDGTTIWWAYLSVVAATLYLGLMVWLQAALFVEIFQRIRHFFRAGG